MTDPGEALRRAKAKKTKAEKVDESDNVTVIDKLNDFHLTYINNCERARERWEALRRNKNYQRNRREALKSFKKRLTMEGASMEELSDEVMFEISPEGQEVALKYGLRLPFNPVDKILDPKKMYIHAAGGIFLDGNIVEIIPQEAVLLPVPEDALILAINRAKHKREIMKAFEAILDCYLIMPKSRGASIDFCRMIGDRKISIYELWDMKYIEGKGAWAIVKELVPTMEGKSPNSYDDNYDKEAKRLKKVIEDAITKADNLIQSFNPAI